MDDVQHAYERIRSTQDIFEKARLLRFLKDSDIRLKDIAKELNMQPSYVSHFLRLNKLPDIVIDGYYARLVTASHLFIVARLKDYKSMVSVYEKILSENLTSTATEIAVREELYQTKTEGERINKDDIERIERLLQRALGEITIDHIQTRIHSKLTITTKGSLEHTTNVIKKLYYLLKESVE
jgi:transcriptional regulator with XRE-family HTH domain